MLGVLEAVAVRASHFLMEYFRAGRGVDVVTRKEDDVTREVDIAAETLIYKMLREAFKEGGVLYAEEGGIYRWGDERHIFVLDPLDGSLNYAVGVPFFAVSIAAGKHREGTLADLEYAVVAIPPTGDVYTAAPGVGARKNGKPLRRTPRSNIVFVAVSNSFPPKTCEVVRRLGLRGRSLGSSAAELAYTVEGTARGFLDLRGKLRLLDVAGALTVGKYVDGFRYVVMGDTKPHSKVSLVAGDVDFVNAATTD
ncbi:MAG: inositol monophosphatase family protein [Pyrobaculum sp.]